MLSGIFIYCITWSFGVSVDTTSRKIFDQLFKKIFAENLQKKKKIISYPDKLTFYDYLFRVNLENLAFDWIKWSELLTVIPLNNPLTKLDDLTVQTNDIIKYNNYLLICIDKAFPIVLCGPTGTGKSTLVKNLYN